MSEKLIRVAVAIIRDEGRFILVKRDDAKTLGGLWEFPGNTVTDGHSLEEGLKEGLATKFNLDVVIGDKLTTMTHEYEFGTVEMTAFYVECISKKLKLVEHLAYRWLKLNHMKDFEIVPVALPLIELLKQKG